MKLKPRLPGLRPLLLAYELSPEEAAHIGEMTKRNIYYLEEPVPDNERTACTTRTVERLKRGFYCTADDLLDGVTADRAKELRRAWFQRKADAPYEPDPELVLAVAVA